MPLPAVANASYNYKYNGKVLQEELGLNMYDYGARNYDVAIGRWMNVDPLAERHPDYTPYAYVLNNPLRYIDPTGMTEEEGDPGKSFWQTVKGWFSSKKSTGTVYVGEVEEYKPEIFSEEWFKNFFSFESYKKSYEDSEFNKERDVFLNKTMPEVAEASREVIDYAGVVPGVDIISSIYIDGDYKQAGINTVLTFGGVLKVGKTGIVANAFSKIPKGFKQVKDFGYQHGQEVYKYKNKYYSLDIDSHNGGAWKVFENVGGKLKRIGTADENLKIFKN